MANDAQKKSLRQQWAEVPLERKIAMFVAPVVVFVITGVLIPRLIGGGPGPATGPSHGRDEQVEVVDLVTFNAPGDDTRIEIAARNIGETVSVLTRVDFRVAADVEYVGSCAAGGGLGVSQTYDLELPIYADRDQVISVPISQEVRPDEADRFAIDVGVVTPSGQTPEPTIYLLDVDLYHDAKDQPVEAGEVVVAEPFPTDAAYFSEDIWLDQGIPLDEVHDCVARNIASVTTVLTWPGFKSAALAGLAQSLER